MLRLDQLQKTFAGASGPVRAVDGICLSVQAGEFVAVQGPSGCGKSTLLLLAGGLLRPEAGKVIVAGQDPYALAPEARARFRAAHVGFVFQQFHLLPYLSARENVLTAALAQPAPDASARAEHLLASFGLGNRLGHVPAALSTGEKQRVALARAMLNRPKLLLADEPTGNLDQAAGQRVLEILADCARQGAAVLLVTHDPRAAGIADRTLNMRGGRLE